MAPSSDRMRLKDRIIDNISKAIKSIQELVYYQYRDPVLSGSSDGVVLYNSDRVCSKLCENLDHTLLHGLKHVIHGYWRVVKQLSPHVMVKEIDLLVNVTTDLGRGRAWLYSSLNEGLLESYIRLLCDNDKLLRKYYAKEALVLDKDRMSVLLTLVSGLDCVTFRLDYDVPYLDLNAYPPRSRSNSGQEDESSCGLPLSRMGHPSLYRKRSEVCCSWSEPSLRRQSDSDSASLDAYSDTACQMKSSTISADSGFPVDSVSSNCTKLHSVTLTDAALNSRHRSETPSDTVSLSSVGSWADPDKHQRLENVVPAEADKEGEVEVFHVKNKKPTISKIRKKKDAVTEKDRKTDLDCKLKPVDHPNFICGEKNKEDNTTAISTTITEINSCINRDSGNNLISMGCTAISDVNSESIVNKSSIIDSIHHNRDSVQAKSIPKFDSGVDICGLAASLGQTMDLNGPHFCQKGKDDPLSASPCHAMSLRLAQSSAENTVEIVSYQDMNDMTNKQSSLQPSSLSNLNQNNCPKFIDSSSVGSMADVLPCQSSLYESMADVLPCQSSLYEVSSCNTSNDTAEIPHSLEENNPTPFSKIQPHQSFIKPDSYELRQPFIESCAPDSSNEPCQPSIEPHCDKLRQSFIEPCAPNSSNEPCQPSIKSHSDKLRQSFTKPNTAYLSSDHLNSTDETTATQTEGQLHSRDSDPSSTVTDIDIYSSSKQANVASCHNDTSVEASSTQTHLQGDSGSIPGPDPQATDTNRQDLQRRHPDLSLSLDNNMKLQIMLDVFTREDEQILKMFVSWENHTEGNSTPVYILLSDHCLYYLQYHKSSSKFTRRLCISLTDISFISTGLNGQTLNIESRTKGKMKQKMWLTPGHQDLTHDILSCLTDAVKSANEHLFVRSRFSVGSEVPLQKIALRKYIARELSCEPAEVQLHDYSLVFWEDLSITCSNNPHAGIHKKGSLLLRVQDSFRSHVWKPVYVVLKNSMLCIVSSKHDSRPFAYLGLGGEQCVGCRQTSLEGHEHCVELILARGETWVLAAGSQAEISGWRHSLCLAVSQGTLEKSLLSSCTPCCAVLACNHLFLCHEDLHTKFYRTLGSARLQDVSSVALDDVELTYVIIDFKSKETGVSSGQWVLYFTSAQDLDRHKAALNRASQEFHQNKSPVVTRVEDLALQSHCRTFSHQLRQQLTLS